ncbi:DMBT1 protein, partial [Semnornis frantzii]|nr:DMBT1 protein [Semnornis frantzii]
RCAGRVEVLHEHQWGTICDDSWDLRDAQVVCRQLGCGTAISSPGQAHFGQGQDPIWLDEVECTGLELSLSQCSHSSWGQHNCNHEEDAGVVCSGCTPPRKGAWEALCQLNPSHTSAAGTNPLQLRLQGSSGPCVGLVEVFYNSSWQRVCSIGWSLLEAEVVCRQLGCG